MAFNVTQFRSALSQDGARPNLFQVNLTPPGTNGSAAGQALQFLGKAASLPGSSLGVATLNYFGRQLKFAGNRTFADWSVTIINDEDFLIRSVLESWSNDINSHITNVRASGENTPSGYTVDGSVIQYSKDGSTVLNTYDIVGMFPTDISPIELDWGTNDTIEEYTVTFAYQYWSNAVTT